MKNKRVVLNDCALEYVQKSPPMFELNRVHSEFILNHNVRDYISRFVNINDPLTDISGVLENRSYDDAFNTIGSNYVHLKKLNDVHYLNSFLGKVNKRLPCSGNLICCAETLGQRKKRILNKYPEWIAYPYYYLLDFPGKRVFPKFELTRKIHDFVTKGNNKTLSFTEVMGRLVYSGFRIVDYKEINNLTYFVADKEKEPIPDQSHSHGIVFKMRRVGKNGNIINVYKLRTMHPYSEYIQKYFFDSHNLETGGKIKNDFRVTSWGRFLRKYWLDELPMIVNLIKGDLKLFGVRPLSEHYLSLYRKDLVQKRLYVKPGLVPPYYADMPKTLDEIMDSEERYIDAYLKHPFRTDIKYLFKVFKNIFIKGKRSS